MRQRSRFSLVFAALAVLAVSACGRLEAEDATAVPAVQVETADSSTTTAAVTTVAPATTVAAEPTTSVELTVPAPASTIVAVEAAARPLAAPSNAATSTETAETAETADDPTIQGASNVGKGGGTTGVRIEIPKIGLSETMHEGVTLDVLDLGLGHWPGTAMPGQNGNMVIAGHRMSHGHVFRDLDLLVPGDTLVATSGGATHTYRVTGTTIVNPDAIWITNPTPNATATLFACHPKGSTRQRIVVNLELV